MKIGFMSFNTEYTMRADRLAAALEERGFESLWLPEHTHIPVPENGDPDTGMPVMPDGGYLPVEYRHMSDPLTSLAAAAAVTQNLLLGTCICLVNQHHPINLAKSVATLDRLAEGRFRFGVGAGWYMAEMVLGIRNVGRSYASDWMRFERCGVKSGQHIGAVTWRLQRAGSIRSRCNKKARP